MFCLAWRKFAECEFMSNFKRFIIRRTFVKSEFSPDNKFFKIFKNVQNEIKKISIILLPVLFKKIFIKKRNEILY